MGEVLNAVGSTKVDEVKRAVESGINCDCQVDRTGEDCTERM